MDKILNWLNWGLPPVASAHGGELDTMLALVHVLVLVLFVGWGFFFLNTLYLFRRSKNPVANYHGVRSHKSTYLEIGVAVAEGVLLVGFSFPLWAERVKHFPAESESVVIRVVAQQFAWNIHYPGPDGIFGKTDIKKVNEETNPLGLVRDDPNAKDDIVTLNQLHIPTGKPVIIKLTSKDVIHSFWLPHMRVKQDAVPGMEVPLWFEPKVTTEEMRQKLGMANFNYEIACAQLCGLGHYRMVGYTTVHTPDGFQKWLTDNAPKPGEAGDEVWE